MKAKLENKKNRIKTKILCETQIIPMNGIYDITNLNHV